MPTGIYERKPQKTTEQFIKEAKLIHGDEYDYSLVNYKNNRTKVKIICQKYGVFEQTPSNHLHITNRSGCPYCYGNLLKTTEQFIEKSIQIWGKDKYDYSEVIYKNNHTKLTLRCLIHDLKFEQTPKKHYKCQGCPKCLKKSKAEEKIDNFFRNSKINFVREYKFKDCKYKKPLPFDFFFPDKNIVLEYQGEQHFKQQKRGHETLQERKLKDQIKRDFCKSNNITEIEITCFDDLDEKLNELLKLLI